MASKKQISANRRNAKKSTGPSTPEGKAASAQNATKHGLLARRALLSDEDPAAYEALRLDLIHDLWPDSPLEKLLVDRIAATQWRLARVPVIEAELFERLRRDTLGRDEGLGAAWARDAGPLGGALARLTRYEAMLERSAARLLAELRKVQAERRAAERREAPASGDGGEWWRRAAAAWPGASEREAAPSPLGGEGRPASAGRGEDPVAAGAREAASDLRNEASGRGKPGPGVLAPGPNGASAIRR